ncbi:class I SAM-dependent methyltransferase [Streptomyces collinus]|uniref:class I SAM-dependent methyltransferase n=1 Tax=Streptomyces collinus TaxID=42684 RepID=UPI003316FAD1
MDHPHTQAHTPPHGAHQAAQPAGAVGPAAQLDPYHDHRHDADDQAELLDLDAEVLAERIASITAWLPLKTAPGRIVDLGCGTGTGTFALLDRFPDAHVIAVDSSAVHLRHLRKKACARGLEQRVRTVQADLDDPAWPALGSPDLVWASASMHHMAHPEQALRNVHEALATGGLFAVVEPAGFPRFLPTDAPADRPGLEERCHAVTDRLDAERMPHRGADWGPMLTAAGFTIEGERTLAVNIEGSHSEVIGRYALGSLRRIRDFVAPELSPEDRAALDRLLDTEGPHSILRRDDLAVGTERTVWAARRP